MKGKLFVVSTPIGNLEDITFRAVETLKLVSFILCEDTRVSSVLMKRYDINTQLISYRDQNHERMIDKVIEKLNLGLNLALISDAGTPTISDPGFRLVLDLKSNDFEVLSIPGPDAVTGSLAVSGLPTDKFIFLGFLPKSEKIRSEMLLKYGNIECTLAIYESPNRVEKLLNQIQSTLGDRNVSICNDLTKKFEKVITNRVSNVLNDDIVKNPKGEYVVLVSKE